MNIINYNAAAQLIEKVSKKQNLFLFFMKR